MGTVNTVLGPVDTANLGFTLSHEHVGTNAAGLRHTSLMEGCGGISARTFKIFQYF